MEPFLSLMAHAAAGRAERLTLSLTRHPAGFAGEAFNILGRHEQGCLLLSYFCFQVKTDETA